MTLLTEQWWALKYRVTCCIVDMLPKVVKEQVVIETVATYTIEIDPFVEMSEVRAVDLLKVF